MKKYAFYLIFLSLFYACANNKEVVKDPALDKFSTASFPYIEKFHSGVRLKAQKKYDEAISAFNYCLTIKQNDDAVYFALGELYRIKNDPNKAIENYKKAAQLDKKNRYYIEELAGIYFENKDFASAAENFGKLTKLDPENIQWLYGYAESLLGAGRSEEAIKALNKMQDEVGANAQFTIQKYQIYMSLNQKDKAETELLNGRKLLPEDQDILGTLVDHYFQNNENEKGIRILEKLVEQDPNNGRANLILGQYNLEIQNKDKALNYFLIAFESDEVEFETKTQIALFYLDNYGTADPQTEAVIQKLLETNRDKALAHSVYADFLVVSNREKEALKVYEDALKIDKSEFSIWMQVFLIQLNEKQFDELYLSSKEAITLFPSLPQIYLYNALAANQIKEYDEALIASSLGKELVVNDPFLKAELIAQEAEAYYGLKSFSEGNKAFEEALKITPGNDLIKNNYAYQLALNNRELDKAQNLLLDLVDKPEVEAYMLDTYGLILFQKKQYSESLAYLSKAYALDSKDFTIIEHMGDVSVKLGKINEAIEFWKMAKTLGSDNKKLDLKIEKKQYFEPEF